MSFAFLQSAVESAAPIDGLSSDGTIWFKPEATEQQRIAAQAIADNWVDPPDPNFDGMLAELMFGSTYPNVQAWFNTLPRTQGGFLEEQIGRQNLERIQWFLDNADTTAIAAELTTLLNAFNMPLTVS